MRKLSIVLMLLFVAIALRGPTRALAKGPGDLIIGGADLAPYYYAIQEPPPQDLGWLGLLASPDGGVPNQAAAPAGAASLLAASYDLSFDGGITQPALGAHPSHYVPRSGDRPAYLYYEYPGGGLPDGWYTLGDEAVAYLDRARDTALRAKAGNGVGLETDPIAALVRHGRYYSGLDGTPSIASGGYILINNAEFTQGGAPQGRVTGDDARGLLSAYIATLHNWHPISEENAGGYHDFSLQNGVRQQFTVFTPANREVFSFVTAADGSVLRVYAAEGFGGYFDPAPALTSLIKRIIPPVTPSESRSSATSARGASRSGGIVAGALAAALLLALGIGAAWAHRSERAVSD